MNNFSDKNKKWRKWCKLSSTVRWRNFQWGKPKKRRPLKTCKFNSTSSSRKNVKKKNWKNSRTRGTWITSRNSTGEKKLSRKWNKKSRMQKTKYLRKWKRKRIGSEGKPRKSKCSEENSIKRNTKQRWEKKNKINNKRGWDRNIKCRGPSKRPNKEREGNLKKNNEWRLTLEHKWCKDFLIRIGWSRWHNRSAASRSRSISEKWRGCGRKNCWLTNRRRLLKSNNF